MMYPRPFLGSGSADQAGPGISNASLDIGSFRFKLLGISLKARDCIGRRLVF